MGGFELLGLCDYTGQGTATIGLLDVFMNSKNILTAEEFRSFCSPVVPLMKADRIFRNTDKFKAEFDLYDYGEEKINRPVFKFTLYDGDTKVYEEETRKKKVSLPLDFIKKPTVLRAALEVGGHKNSWNIYVYTDENVECNIPILNGIDESFMSLAENGGKAIVMMSADNLCHAIDGLFKPVFWSPAHFPSDRMCGFICDSSHKALGSFPTEDYPDFQWKHPIDNSTCADVSVLPDDFKYIIEPVPNFYNNIRRSPLFEAKVKNAYILFCGFDLSVNRPAVKALRNSIFKYVNSDSFNPANTLSIDDLKKIFK